MENEEEHKKHLRESKKKLYESVRKKILTATVGALSEFEEKFGYIWGRGEDVKTADQLEFENMWNEVRSKILDKGNTQINLIQNELAKYDVDLNSVTYIFRFKERE